MGAKQLLSRRLVLRSSTDEESVDEYAARLGLARHADIPADEEEGVPRQILWHAGSGPALHYREDLFSGLPYIVFTSQDAGALHEAVELAEVALDTWRIPDLWRAVDTGRDSDQWPEDILRMGLGAPEEFDEEIFSRVIDALHSDRDDVCEAGLIATTYQPWDAYVEPVRELLLREGLSKPLAETAQTILDEFGAADS
ncbi:hypothetical protein [Streptomyces sp. NPDC007988]|uniref:hypothetical protein n=1 Tax=Streptomyces sp. NPDC007988 TaxID=3364802 RepID=UPI0036EAC696